MFSVIWFICIIFNFQIITKCNFQFSIFKNYIMNNQTIKFNLEERTFIFSEKLICFCRKVPLSPINNPLINQLIRSGTSIGANYCEANGASSRKDFKNKIYICKKEAKETKYWLRLIAGVIDQKLVEESEWLRREAEEFSMIYTAIAKNTHV
jgi:four helix bundle protein